MNQLAVVGTQINTIEAVGEQAELIRELVRRQMIEGVDYGIIPGTKKQSLYKSGAEKICLLFNLAPEYDVTIDKMEEDHREVTVKCRLINRMSDQLFGAGVGSCSTMESKYKYRIEWVNGDKQRTFNKDLADQYNTVLKMAKKRAMVDASISSGACGNMFTQDTEDMHSNAMAGGYAEQNVTPESSAPRRQKYCYMVHYGAKDHAKRRGGKWNPAQKTWDFDAPQEGWEGAKLFSAPASTTSNLAAAVSNNDEPPPYEDSVEAGTFEQDDLPGF